ncbi:MAG TPA: alpha/beta fold hydrolase [Xanthobacteraceae bacterium]
MPARPPWIDHFGDNFLWSNASLIIKGMAPYGVVALEEIDRVCERLKVRQNEPDAWFEEWGAMGALLEGRAMEAEKAGRKHTAGDYYLRAGNYLYNAERFLRPGPEKRVAGERAFRSYHAGIRLRYPNIERVEVPYEGTTLPALFMKAAAAGPAPTVVIVNGMDNCKEMSIFFAGLEFARRGMNTLALDGPGQGETLRSRGIHSRFDYEVPGAAAYDWLAQRPEVDGKRVAIMGYSFGGYYSGRIAAFEKRYAAGISLSALHWDLADWQTRIKEKNKSDPKAVAQSNFQFQWVVNAPTPDEAIEVARKFTLKDVAQNITCPYLVTHGGNDRVVPVENAPKLFEAIGSKNKMLKIFSTEEGGAEHAHVDNRQVGIDYAADWLAENM